MTLARCLVLMAASMVGSVVQLPVIGWFTQIGVTTGVMQKIFNVQFEPALACGTMLLIVTFMSVIPLGLIWARLEHVSIKKISQESEHLEQEDAERTRPSAKRRLPPSKAMDEIELAAYDSCILWDLHFLFLSEGMTSVVLHSAWCQPRTLSPRERSGI